jgi:dienelactone hydrolase
VLPRFLVISALVLLAAGRFSHAADDSLADTLKQLDASVLPAGDEKAKQLATMLGDDIRARRSAANQRETKLWREIKNRTDWERFRDVRLQALRDSLGIPLATPKDLKVQVTGSHDGDGYRVENIVFESRPGLLVTANLYSPKQPGKSMPGFVICPSHHNPKTQSELQDMGMSWAHLGCVVIVPDTLGHGERRQHPFRTAADYAGKFAVGRQDYHFRYNVGMQLHLVGESLIGWIVWDLERCVDVLLTRPGVDKERIVLLGAVAGGGDPAAVAGALDPRIRVVGPFNFGGPQPETIFPLPDDADAAFNYAGGGSWESTRNLRRSASDGFMPWVIVGAAAPRPLMYAHEFAWDQDRDPVWKRLQTIYGFYDVGDNLSSCKGKGKVSGPAGPENTHCNNIGLVHRQGMYPAFNRWLKMEFATDKEYRERHKPEELLCLTPEIEKARPSKAVHELATALAAERGAAFRERLSTLKPEERRQRLCQEWARLLGNVEPGAPKVTVQNKQKAGTLAVERVLLETEPRLAIPLLVLLPELPAKGRLPVVVAVAQEGKQAFLKQRSAALAELLRGGAAVCLVDVRGTGETKPGDGRGRQSAATSLSSSELMLGSTVLGARLRDLRSVLKYLRDRKDLDSSRIAVWGESFAPVNAMERDIRVPLDAEKQPDQAEPLGGLLALFVALYEPEVRAVSVQGGLSGFSSVLQSQFCYVPHDVIVPGALTLGDLQDVTATLAPRPVRLEALVDGVNRRLSTEELARAYAGAQTAYREAAAQARLVLEAGGQADTRRAEWLLAQLKSR